MKLVEQTCMDCSSTFFDTKVYAYCKDCEEGQKLEGVLKDELASVYELIVTVEDLAAYKDAMRDCLV